TQFFDSAPHGLIKALCIDRLQQVIHCVHFESTKCVFIKSSNENHRRQVVIGNGGKHIERIQFGHLYVEENQIGPLHCDRRCRLPPVAAFSNHIDVWICSKQGTNSFSRQRFVVDDESADHNGTSSASCTEAARYGIVISTISPPSGAALNVRFC